MKIDQQFRRTAITTESVHVVAPAAHDVHHASANTVSMKNMPAATDNNRGLEPMNRSATQPQKKYPTPAIQANCGNSDVIHNPADCETPNQTVALKYSGTMVRKSSGPDDHAGSA